MKKICGRCGECREEKDFLMGDKKCYKCVYKEKEESGLTKLKKHLCRQCQLVLDSARLYCSEECEYLWKKKQKASHWTKLVKSL